MDQRVEKILVSRGIAEWPCQARGCGEFCVASTSFCFRHFGQMHTNLALYYLQMGKRIPKLARAISYILELESRDHKARLAEVMKPLSLARIRKEERELRKSSQQKRLEVENALFIDIMNCGGSIPVEVVPDVTDQQIFLLRAWKRWGYWELVNSKKLVGGRITYQGIQRLCEKFSIDISTYTKRKV